MCPPCWLGLGEQVAFEHGPHRQDSETSVQAQVTRVIYQGSIGTDADIQGGESMLFSPFHWKPLSQTGRRKKKNAAKPRAKY